MSGGLNLQRYVAYWVVASIVTVVVFALCLCVGPEPGPEHWVNLGWPGDWNILEIRLLRVATAALVGVALAGAGVALQALLRNALADPYVLGISSGASVGVMVWLLATSATWIAHSPTLLSLMLSGSTLPAVAGALLTCGAVFVLARGRAGQGQLDPLTLLLVGVVVSAVNGAIIMVLNNLAPGGIKVSLINYMMGNIGGGSWRTLQVAGGAVILGWLPLLLMARSLNIATLSDVEVASLGVKISTLRNMSFLSAAVMTAASIALAGPIGFVGLICPHVCRTLFGPDHRQLTVTAPFFGAIFLMVADTFVRSTGKFFQGDLPVGVITALAGGPFFLLLLRRRVAGGNYAE